MIIARAATIPRPSKSGPIGQQTRRSGEVFFSVGRFRGALCDRDLPQQSQTRTSPRANYFLRSVLKSGRLEPEQIQAEETPIGMESDSGAAKEHFSTQRKGRPNWHRCQTFCLQAPQIVRVENDQNLRRSALCPLHLSQERAARRRWLPDLGDLDVFRVRSQRFWNPLTVGLEQIVHERGDLVWIELCRGMGIQHRRVIDQTGIAL